MSRDTELRRLVHRHLPGLLVALMFFVVASVYALSHYAQLLDGAYDLGIFDQAIRAYSHFRAPVVPIKGDGYLIFGDHFHPILVVLAPLYWIWNDPRVLLVAQAALLAVSVVVVWRFTLRRLGVRWVALLVAIGYAFGWSVQGMVDFDFHEVAFAVPLIAWAIDAFDRRRDRELFVASALLLLVREDMGVVVAALGVLRIVRGLRSEDTSDDAPEDAPVDVPAGRPERYTSSPEAGGRWARTWPGVVMVGVGVLAFVVIVGFVIPAFNPSGRYSHWDYTGLGPDIGSSLWAVVAHPLATAHLLVTPTIKVTTLVALLVPVALLPLVSPYTLVALLLLVERFLDSRPELWSTHFHYNAPVWVVLVLAAVDGWCRLARTPWARRVPAVRRTVGTVLVVAFAAYPILATLTASTVGTATFPFGRMVTGSAFRVGAADHDALDAVATVPAGVCVVASAHLAPLLDAHDVVTLTEVSRGHQDYLVLDLASHEPDRFKLVPDVASIQAEPVYEQALADGWVVTDRVGDVVVLRAPDYAGPSADCTP